MTRVKRVRHAAHSESCIFFFAMPPLGFPKFYGCLRWLLGLWVGFDPWGAIKFRSSFWGGVRSLFCFLCETTSLQEEVRVPVCCAAIRARLVAWACFLVVAVEFANYTWKEGTRTTSWSSIQRFQPFWTIPSFVVPKFLVFQHEIRCGEDQDLLTLHQRKVPTRNILPGNAGWNGFSYLEGTLCTGTFSK